jgi:hypothetical protein
MLASEMAVFSLPDSVAGTASVPVVVLAMVMAADWVPELAPLLLSVVVTARVSLPLSAPRSVVPIRPVASSPNCSDESLSNTFLSPGAI